MPGSPGAPVLVPTVVPVQGVQAAGDTRRVFHGQDAALSPGDHGADACPDVMLDFSGFYLIF